MDCIEEQPLEPAAATTRIRRLAGPELRLRYTKHAKDRMMERGMIIGDILHVIKNGAVRRPGEPSTRPGLFKYQIECVTPNSNGRTVRLVVIPSENGAIKIVTVMWSNEIEEPNDDT